MSEAYIGRRSAIGLGKETTHGTKAPVEVWIPKESWLLNPSFEEAQDTSWYGVIDEVYDSFTTKNSSSCNLSGIVRDDFIGYLLLGAMGTYTKVKCFTGASITGTPKRWDVVTGGILKKIIKVWDETYYFFSGTVSGGEIEGTDWSGTFTEVKGVNGHFFERLNSNNHPSFTMYDDDPIAWSYAPYCMVNTFEISCEVADYVKFSCEMMGKQMQDNETAVTPVYTDDNAFTASMAGVRFADTEDLLNNAGTQCMQNFRLTINKNLTDVQCFGSTDIDSLHNQQFTIDGDFEALYTSTTLRDYVINSQKKAVRFSAINTNVEPLDWEGGAIYPSIYIDCMKVGLNEWTKTDSLNEVIKQTMGFSGQYDNATGATLEILLINWNSTWY